MKEKHTKLFENFFKIRKPTSSKEYYFNVSIAKKSLHRWDKENYEKYPTIQEDYYTRLLICLEIICLYYREKYTEHWTTDLPVKNIVKLLERHLEYLTKVKNKIYIPNESCEDNLYFLFMIFEKDLKELKKIKTEFIPKKKDDEELYTKLNKLIPIFYNFYLDFKETSDFKLNLKNL